MNMSNLASEIEALLEKKSELLRGVEEIDVALERVKLALSGGSPIRRTEAPRRRPVGEVRREGSLANEILAALAIREPLTQGDIHACTGANDLALGRQLKAMANSGQIARMRLSKGTGLPYVYARTRDALRAFVESQVVVEAQPQEAAEAAEAAEPG